MTKKAELLKDLEIIFYKLDNEGTDYAVENGYADSEIVEKTYPDYKKAKNELKKALSKFEQVWATICEENDLGYD